MVQEEDVDGVGQLGGAFGDGAGLPGGRASLARTKCSQRPVARAAPAALAAAPEVPSGSGTTWNCGVCRSAVSRAQSPTAATTTSTSGSGWATSESSRPVRWSCVFGPWTMTLSWGITGLLRLLVGADGPVGRYPSVAIQT